MINIRSITYNMPKKYGKSEFDTIKKCKQSFDDFKYFVRTQRISTVPITKPLSMEYYDSLSNFCKENNIRWFNIPLDAKDNELLEYGYKLLKKYDHVFINVDCVKNSIVNFDIINDAIKLTKKVAKISKDGKDNFRLGLSINILNNTPFFPYAKSSGEFTFSIALELTQEINLIIKKNKKKNIKELRDIIVDTIDKQLDEIEKYANKIEKEYNIKFVGFDFSLAPIIEENGSIISIINHLGVDDFSKSGVLFSTYYLTNILKSFANKHKQVGFSGVMYSLLEDIELCKINNSKGVNLEDLIKLSTMCGCGIDMVPIDINTNNDYIRSAILDVVAISCRLNKPLGIRFLPVTTRKTKFKDDKDFISNTKVINIKGNKMIRKERSLFDFLKQKNAN